VHLDANLHILRCSSLLGVVDTRMTLRCGSLLRPRAGSRVVLFGGVAILIILAMTAGVLVQLRAAAVHTAEHHMNILATALGEQSERAMQTVDMLLDSIGRYMAASDDGAGVNAPATHEVLRDRIAGVPQVKYATIIGADGTLKVSTFSNPVVDVWLGDRHYFTAHRDAADRRLRVVEAVQSRTTGEWLIMYSRRWESPSGSFNGVFNMALDPAHFGALYRKLALREDSAINLVREDGTIVAAFPDADQFIGKHVDGANFRDVVAAPEGTVIELMSAVSQRARFFTRQKVEGYPLMVVLSVDKAAVLATWRRQLAMIGAAAILAVLAILTLLARLQVSGSENERILDAAPDALAMVDSAGRIVRINGRLESMFGYHAADLLGAPVETLVPDHARERHARHRAGYAAASRPRLMGLETMEPQGRRRDGRRFPVEINLNPLTLGGAQFVIATIRDTSERTRTENALKNTAASLREAREMIAAIVDASPVAIFALNEERKVLVWNRAAEALTGYTAKELVGGSYPLVPKHREEEFEAYFRRALAGESLRGVQVTRRRKDGTLRQVQFAAEPLYDAGGRIHAVIYAVEDTTDRVAMELQLRQAQKLDAIGQLTGGVAHDFNNILTVIMGTSEMLSASVAEQPRLLAHAKTILRATQRGAELVRQLMAFARKQMLAPTRTEVNALIVETAQLLQPTLGEAIKIESVLEGDAWPALIDASLLSTALLNLAVNARDAMPDGGTLTFETANVLLDATYAQSNADVTPGPYVMIAVTDTGTGMPSANLDKVFEPFFTTKDAGKGTGLGLSMVYGFVRQSGGHIKIYSEEGFGTAIKLYLPRSSDPADAAAPATTVGVAEAEAEAGGGETILVVEDDAMVRAHVVALLESLGYRTLVAWNGDAALAMVQDGGDFDLLFTDVIMPGDLNGWQLADAIAERRGSLRVLYTCGYTENTIKRHGRLDPGATLLTQPYRKLDLARKIREVLAAPPAPGRS